MIGTPVSTSTGRYLELVAYIETCARHSVGLLYGCDCCAETFGDLAQIVAATHGVGCSRCRSCFWL